MFFDDDVAPEDKPHWIEYPVRFILLIVLLVVGYKAFSISDFGWMLTIASWLLAIANIVVIPKMITVVRQTSIESDDD